MNGWNKGNEIFFEGEELAVCHRINRRFLAAPGHAFFDDDDDRSDGGGESFPAEVRRERSPWRAPEYSINSSATTGNFNRQVLSGGAGVILETSLAVKLTPKRTNRAVCLMRRYECRMRSIV